MELKDIVQLFITVTTRVDFYWNFYVVTLLALIGWMFSTKKPMTTHLKLLITVGYIVFVSMNLVGLWGSYTFAEALRNDLLSTTNLKPDEFKNTRVVLAESSFLAQRSVTLVIHAIVGAVVLLTVWFGRLGDDTLPKAEKSEISAEKRI